MLPGLFGYIKENKKHASFFKPLLWHSIYALVISKNVL